MAIEEIVVVLPERNEMLRRLVSVNDLDYLVTKFYPMLLKKAGRRLVGANALVIMLVLEINDLATNVGSAAIKVGLYKSVPDYIRALVDDRVAQATILEAWERARRSR